MRGTLTLPAAALAVLLSFGDLHSQAPVFRADSVEVDGAWIYYRAGGEGPTLLLLHGFTGTGVWWEPFIEQFAESYRVVVPDLPGHGHSGEGPHPYRFDYVAADLHAFMDGLGIDRFRAIGYSGGGIALIHMAVQEPRRIESMALLSATHVPSRAVVRGFPDFDDHPRRVRENWLETHPGGRQQVQELIAAFRGLAEVVPEITVTRGELSTVGARTLLIVGDRDPMIPLDIPLEMYEAIPGAALWVVPAQGHSAMWPDWGGSTEMASVFPAMVTRFLGTEPLEAPAGR